MNVANKDIKKLARCLCFYAFQETGCETTIHAIHQIFQLNEAESILLADAENAFNSINREGLHHIEYLSPIFATFLCNCYAISTQLFIIVWKELKLSEGITQGDSIVMVAYV